MSSPVEIVGAGPAGLTAALTAASLGHHAVVYERGADAGGRFHGDFQGLENCTDPCDVLDEVSELGIAPDFERAPFRECVFWDSAGREYVVRSERPLFYLVRRGTEPGSLDQALKKQALEAGVEIRFGERLNELLERGIVALGPRRADAISTGYTFETDAPDGIYTVASDRFAPAGYAYLLNCAGRGTVAACMFRSFPSQGLGIERTVDFFREKAGLHMKNPRRFSGYARLYRRGSARQGNVLFAGEAAGFQDALFGFGMRYALLPGHFAARALLQGAPETYDRLWRRRFGRQLKISSVNRFLYEFLDDRGYTWLLRRISEASDARDWLRDYSGRGRLKSLLYPLVGHRPIKEGF